MSAYQLRQLALAEHPERDAVAVQESAVDCAPIRELARKEMQLNPHPLQTAAEEHVYFSKEASSGGRGFAGGGCGCN